MNDPEFSTTAPTCLWLNVTVFDWIYKTPVIFVLGANIVFLTQIMWVRTFSRKASFITCSVLVIFPCTSSTIRHDGLVPTTAPADVDVEDHFLDMGTVLNVQKSPGRVSMRSISGPLSRVQIPSSSIKLPGGLL